MNVSRNMISSCTGCVCCFFFKQKSAYELRISDWSSDVCSSDLGLLHSLARHIAGDRRVFALARILVALIDVDNAHLRLVDVVITLLQQFLDDVLVILATVPGLLELGGVVIVDRHITYPRPSLAPSPLALADRPPHTLVTSHS